MKPWPRSLAVVVATISLLSAACGGGTQSGGSQSVCSGNVNGTVTFNVWFHGGQANEVKAMQDIVSAFNSSQSQVKANLVVPSGSDYTTTVKAAAKANQLPDLLDFDGPTLPNFAWAGNLVPIDSCIPASLESTLLKADVEQGTYSGHLYGVGYYEGSFGIFVDKSVLQANNIRIPTGPGDAWKADEFTQILKKLQAAGFKHPLDLKVNYGVGEWYTFAFSPFIQSAGADLINRKSYQTADGTLNSQAAIKALTLVQSWFKDGLVDQNVDDASFITGRTPLSLVGGWEYPRYKKALGDKLFVVPPPDFGNGTKSGNGSWQWGITNRAKADAAAAFLKFMFSPSEVTYWPLAAGQAPPTTAAFEASKVYGPGGDLNLYAQLLQGGYTVTRPVTPAYPTITAQFAKAVDQIFQGQDVKTALDAAVAAIDSDIKDNDGYPPPKA
jgi:multiple sugar transport system substrate-binding protein